MQRNVTPPKKGQDNHKQELHRKEALKLLLKDHQQRGAFAGKQKKWGCVVHTVHIAVLRESLSPRPLKEGSVQSAAAGSPGPALVVVT